MVRTCSAIVRSTGLPCTCRVNDTGIFCGRHGGLSQNSVRQINSVFPVITCSATVRSTGLRCTCPVISRGGAVCGHHIGWTRTRNSNVDFLEAFEALNIEKEEVEMDYISKFYCCICMEDVDSENAGCQMNCCKKGFCIGCINKWVETSTSCPHCRAEIK